MYENTNARGRIAPAKGIGTGAVLGWSWIDALGRKSGGAIVLLKIAIGNRLWRAGVTLGTLMAVVTEIGVEIVGGNEGATTAIGVGMLRTGTGNMGKIVASIEAED